MSKKQKTYAIETFDPAPYLCICFPVGNLRVHCRLIAIHLWVIRSC